MEKVYETTLRVLEDPGAPLQGFSMDGSFRIYVIDYEEATGLVEWEATLEYPGPRTDYSFYQVYLQVWDPLYELYVSSTCVYRYLQSDNDIVSDSNVSSFSTCGTTDFSKTTGNYNKQKDEEQCVSFEVDF